MLLPFFEQRIYLNFTSFHLLTYYIKQCQESIIIQTERKGVLRLRIHQVPKLIYYHAISGKKLKLTVNDVSFIILRLQVCCVFKTCNGFKYYGKH